MPCATSNAGCAATSHVAQRRREREDHAIEARVGGHPEHPEDGGAQAQPARLEDVGELGAERIALAHLLRLRRLVRQAGAPLLEALREYLLDRLAVEGRRA